MNILFSLSAVFKKEGETPAKRETKSIRLSRFAAHNAFHHCEQCHHYCEAVPATQVSAVWCPTSHLLPALGLSNFKHCWFIDAHTYTKTCQNNLTLESFLLSVVTLVNNACVCACVCCSCRSAPFMLSPSARPCWGRRSSSSSSFPKPRSSTLSSVSRGATWRACVCLWSPPRLVYCILEEVSLFVCRWWAQSKYWPSSVFIFVQTHRGISGVENRCFIAKASLRLNKTEKKYIFTIAGFWLLLSQKL